MAGRLTDQERLWRAISERHLQETVTALATALGWRWYHPPDNRPITARSGSRYVQNVRGGFPDLIASRGTRLLAIELKTETGRLQPGQLDWLHALHMAGVEVAIWRPRHLRTAEAVLRGAPMPAEFAAEIAALLASPTPGV